MNNSRILILLAGLVILRSGCAHKSGHRKGGASTSNGASHNNTVTVSNARRTNNKLDGKDIFSKYNGAVFMVYTSDDNFLYQGSGFFLNDKGLAVSNYHVFEGTTVGEECIKLAGSDVIYKVDEVVHRDADEDFILFYVNVKGNDYIPVARTKPSVGEKVYAIGSPRGLENTFSSGEVSQWRDDNLMQISALIDHGSSGGALINEYGEAVGITSGTFCEGSQANLNYAWSINVIKPYVNCK